MVVPPWSMTSGLPASADFDPESELSAGALVDVLASESGVEVFDG